ncbi:MAG: MlaD family protein [Caldimonas sp.]
MAESSEEDGPASPPAALQNLPRPKVDRPRRLGLSLVWLVPIVALLVAGSLFVRTVILVGPRIDIEFATADGIEPGKTDVRYKEVVVGKVQTVSLRGDRKRVIVTVRLDRSAAGLAVKDTQFWVVRPRIGAGGISGLGTLLSGAYIGTDAGVSEESRDSFVGLEGPPFVLRGEPGSVFVLRADDLGSLEVGSPVLYRRTRVGRVVGYTLDPALDEIAIRVFVEAPYHTLVTSQARFWNASGVDVRLSASGLAFNAQSVATVLAGGVAFELPPGVPKAEPARPDSRFVLFNDRRAALAPEDGVPIPVRMIFDQTARGLAENAPIDFLGIEIGRVRTVSLDYDAKRQSFPVRVMAEIFPLRLGAVRGALFSGIDGDPAAELNVLKRMVEKGLRAQLRTGNLLTGQLFVALDFVPKANKATATVADGTLDMPTVPGTLSEVQSQVAEIVQKMAKVPFEEIGTNLAATLGQANKAIAQLTPEARKALAEASAAIGQLTPEAKKALAEVERTLARAQASLDSLDRNVTNPNAPLQRNVEETMEELRRAAQSLRTLSDYLQLHPESLLRGKPGDPALPAGRSRP